MKTSRAYKVELDPNNEQRTAMLRHCGAARFVYNWGLAEKKRQREAGEKVLGAQKLDGELRQIMDAEFPWLREVSSQCRQGALSNLDKAYKNFFDRVKKGKQGKATGFPKFKSRKNGLGGFNVFGYEVEADRIRIAKIGWVRLKECGYIPTGGYGKNTETVRFYGARVSERAGRWYVSAMVEIETPDPQPRQEHAIGVDVGIKALATTSDGQTFANPKALEQNLKKLKRIQRAQSRKYEAAKKAGRPLRECKNFQKNSRQVARLHAKIANLRTHNLHYASHVITRKSSGVAVESLNVSGMMKNRKLARAVADASFGELLRQIQYKAVWRGVHVFEASQWFASSKTCNACGVVNPELTLSQRRWKCPCGVQHDRDRNAAVNLRDLMAASLAVTACGEGSSGAEQSVPVPLGEAGTGQGVVLPVSAGASGEPLASSVRGLHPQLSLF